MITLKEIEKSFRSHKRAIKQMFELFPNAQFEQNSSSYNNRDFGAFRAYGVSFKEFAKIANRTFVVREELFDFGRPKIIEKEFFVYTSDFVRISMYFDIPYSIYANYGSNGDMEITLTMEWSGNSKGIGLKDWKKNYEEILSYFDENPNKGLMREYREQITEANKEVVLWRKKIKEVRAIL